LPSAASANSSTKIGDSSPATTTAALQPQGPIGVGFLFGCVEAGSASSSSGVKPTPHLMSFGSTGLFSFGALASKADSAASGNQVVSTASVRSLEDAVNTGVAQKDNDDDDPASSANALGKTKPETMEKKKSPIKKRTKKWKRVPSALFDSNTKSTSMFTNSPWQKRGMKRRARGGLLFGSGRKKSWITVMETIAESKNDEESDDEEAPRPWTMSNSSINNARDGSECSP
jgi:hypothetical protein